MHGGWVVEAMLLGSDSGKQGLVVDVLVKLMCV
jgi:hypothetical protein